MRLLDAEPKVIADLKEEGEQVAVKENGGVRVTAIRHTTLGKVVLVEGPDGNGVIVEADQ